MWLLENLNYLCGSYYISTEQHCFRQLIIAQNSNQIYFSSNYWLKPCTPTYLEQRYYSRQLAVPRWFIW